ncbi:MAG: 1,4-alpha-glucan branching protein GlgB [Proteobacteria bacterium]|nr:1,4-alpha-glucan branching protein GlgB [Pseudomonadota bacterium]
MIPAFRAAFTSSRTGSASTPSLGAARACPQTGLSGSASRSPGSPACSPRARGRAVATELSAAAVEALARGAHGDPFAVLGMHGGEGQGPLVVRAFLPRATAVAVVESATGARLANLVRVHPEGLFEGRIEGRRARFAYRLALKADGGEVEIEDPYRFSPVLGDLDVHLLAEGSHLEAYKRLGAHPAAMEGIAGVSFAVWAPNARRVSVVGSFNDWDGRRHPMRLRRECGVWEIFLPGVALGALYKYEIIGRSGELLPLKADPYAFFQERPPGNASIVHGLKRHDWRDGAWMEARERAQARDRPISIYEVHLGSWRRRPEEGNRYLGYRELADRLVPYVRDLGFTHIELLPVSEYPFDGSWGYQPISLFAPTSRFGPPEDFRGFVERCHGEGIGVLADWVPGHFPSDPHGLGFFDGTHLYEHADPRKGRHMDWDTLIYNFGRREVGNYLVSNALFWLNEYHLDGLRVDAVASMLYLDYSRRPGQWIPNQYGGNENLEALAFLRRLNEMVYGRAPGAITVAEESTAWPMVSRPTHLGGLGFGFKWNMGWMHDTLAFLRHDPVHRRYHYDRLTFGLLYAFSENFVLPLSHDEVVHGKGSLIGKMPGDRWQRFANLRAYYGFLFTYPGKKLLFMGGEFAQEREWNHDESLDWHLLSDPLHAGVQRLVGDLNRLYRERRALHELDCESDGFRWIDCADVEQSVVSYLRLAREAGEFAVVVCNFTPVVRPGYRVGVPAPGRYAERLNTDATEYGGSGVGNLGGVEAEAVPWHGQPCSLVLTLPPLATLVLLPPPRQGRPA